MSRIVDTYPWESEDQKKAFFNLVSYLRKHYPNYPDIEMGELPGLVACVSAYFIQKDIESNAHWVKLVGDQISSLIKEIQALQLQIREHERLLRPLG